MARSGWYMMAYDIANPRRLARVHYRLKKEGIAVQKSVFFVHGTEAQVNAVLDRLLAVIDSSEDDIRAYPVTHPRDVWTTGGPLQRFPLLRPGGTGRGRGRNGKKRKTGWRQKIVAWFRRSG